MNNKINPSAEVKDSDVTSLFKTKPSTSTLSQKPYTQPRPFAPPKPISPAKMAAFSKAEGTACESCKLLLEQLRIVNAKLQRFSEQQRGIRQRSRKISKLLENTDIVFALRDKGISNRKQAALWECSEASIRRILSGELTADNAGGKI